MKQDIFYTIDSNDLAGHRYEIQLEISNPDPAGQILSLPCWIPGSYLIRDFSRHIESLKAFNNEHKLSTIKLDNHSWQIEPSSGPIHINYTVYAWDLSVRGAHLDETHGFFNGTSVFLKVHGQEQQSCLLHIKQPENTSDWKVYTGLTEANEHPKAASRYGFGVYQADNYDALIDHPVEMSAGQLIQFDVFGTPHEMVFTGLIPNLDLERIKEDTQKICEAQVRLFEPETLKTPFVESNNRYLFMTYVTGSDYGGLEHRNSTALMCSRYDLPVIGQSEQSDGYRQFLGLVSHEYFHSWNVKRIKPQTFAPYDLSTITPTTLLWVFEGFTSYYDDLMVYRSGCTTKKDYLKILEKTINLVENTAGRHIQSVAESSFDAWTKFYKQDENANNAIVSYYSKGALVALCLDLYIQQESQGQASLDDVMRYLWQHFGKSFYQNLENKGIAEEQMAQIIQAATQVEVKQFLSDYVYGTKDLPLKTLLANKKIKLKAKPSKNTATLDVRFKAEQNEVVLAAVFKNGNAHRAGLSAHDRLIAIDHIRIDADNHKKLLARYQVGQSAQIHVFRRDELRSFKLTFNPAVRTDYELIATEKHPS